MKTYLILFMLMLSMNSLAQTDKEFYILDSISADSMNVYRSKKDGHYYVASLNTKKYYLCSIDFFYTLFSFDYSLGFQLFGYKDIEIEFPKIKDNKKVMRRAYYEKNPSIYYKLRVKGDYFNTIAIAMDGLDPYKFEDPGQYYTVYVPFWK